MPVANLLSENLQFITVCIEDDVGEIAGTGFLVGDTSVELDERGKSRPTWKTPMSRAYLVTARHVLGDTASEIETTISYGLRYNSRKANDFLLARSDFLIANDPRNWAVHPDASVDVAVLDVTEWSRALPADAYLRFVPFSELANAVNLAQGDYDAGDDVYVLGYPLKLRQGASNLPIVRKGVLATSPRRPLTADDGGPLRGFLVDGAILPFSSGSPVIGTSSRFFAGDLQMTPARPLVLGVVAEEWGRGPLARYKASVVKAPIEGYANLGFAHSASAVVETIARLGVHDIRDFLRRDHDHFWAPQTGIPEWSLDGSSSVDAETIDRIMRRLHRDRIRKSGRSVPVQDWHDALEIMGPVSESGNVDFQSGANLRNGTMIDAQLGKKSLSP